MKKTLLSFCISFLLLFLTMAPASAHVVVKPNEVGIGAFQTFNVGVPVEKDLATTEIRLVLPEGLNYVTPNVKPGWTITVSESGEGESAKATEIIWSGNSIPAGFREDFQFSAQVPAESKTLSWKAYQTYEDGSIVAWDKDPKSEQPKTVEGQPDFSQYGPYSETKVKNDLGHADAEHVDHEQKANNSFVLSIFAVILSAVALGMQLYKKK